MNEFKSNIDREIEYDDVGYFTHVGYYHKLAVIGLMKNTDDEDLIKYIEDKQSLIANEKCECFIKDIQVPSFKAFKFFINELDMSIFILIPVTTPKRNKMTRKKFTDISFTYNDDETSFVKPKNFNEQVIIRILSKKEPRISELEQIHLIFKSNPNLLNKYKEKFIERLKNYQEKLNYYHPNLGEDDDE